MWQSSFLSRTQKIKYTYLTKLGKVLQYTQKLIPTQNTEIKCANINHYELRVYKSSHLQCSLPAFGNKIATDFSLIQA